MWYWKGWNSYDFMGKVGTWQWRAQEICFIHFWIRQGDIRTTKGQLENTWRSSRSANNTLNKWKHRKTKNQEARQKEETTKQTSNFQKLHARSRLGDLESDSRHHLKPFTEEILDRTPIWIWRSMVVYCKSCCSHLRSAVLPQMKRNWTEWFRMEPLCYFVCFSLQNWHNHSRNWVISHPLLSSPGFLTGNGKGVAIYNFNVFYLFQTMHKIILPNSSICPRHF